MMQLGLALWLLAHGLVTVGFGRPTADTSPVEDLFDSHAHMHRLVPREVPTDASGLTYDTKIPKWPLQQVGTTWIAPSKDYSNLNVTIMNLHNASCLSSPLTNYQFLNGTIANITYGDQLAELKEAFKPGNQKMVQDYMTITRDIAWETLQLANDTLEWINWTDEPGSEDSGILPGESLLPMPESWFPKGWFDPVTKSTTFETSKRRRATGNGGNDEGDIETGKPDRPSTGTTMGAREGGPKPGEDPPRESRDQFNTLPGLGPFPRDTTEGGQTSVDDSPPFDEENPDPNQNQNQNQNQNTGGNTNQDTNQNTNLQASEPIQRGWKERTWDVVIILIGSAIGAALSYGLLEAGTHIYPVNRKPELANMFGAMSLAVGIITGVIIGVIQKYRIDLFNSNQAQALRNTVQDMNAELRSLRAEMKSLASQAATKTAVALTPNRPAAEIAEEVKEKLIKKPYEEVKSTTKAVVEKTASGLKRSGSAFGSAGNLLANAVEKALDSVTSTISGGGSDSNKPDPSTSEPPNTGDPGPSSSSDPTPFGASAAQAELNWQDEAGLRRNPHVSTLQMKRASTAPRLCRMSERFSQEFDDEESPSDSGGSDILETA